MSIQEMTDVGNSSLQQSEKMDQSAQRFLALAVRGLERMFDRQRGLFCHSLKRVGNRLVQEGISPRYTMMTLMGLHRWRQNGGESSFDIDAILDALLADLNWLDNLGDLGVLLWLCGVVCPDRFAEVERRIEVQTALTRYRGARQRVTMELAWFLTGVSYWGQSIPEKRPQLERLAFATYGELAKNRGEHSFYGHQARSGSIAGIARGRIGSFADQVYPIYALNQFAKAYQHRGAAEQSLSCALGICEAQGSQGQWWWHYDSVSGHVADGYPVFSVHQHAMAPMTLFALGETIQYDFKPWISRGLQWINSGNELAFDMEDASEAVIWRCIFRSRRSLGRYLKTGFGHPWKQIQDEHPEDLKVLYECRPYELGWLMYAFAGRCGMRLSSLAVAPNCESIAVQASGRKHR
jgi:hypothetical protein